MVWAMLFFLRPAAQAWILARALPARAADAFGLLSPTRAALFKRTPFEFGKLFFGEPLKPVSVQEYVYWTEGDEMRHLDFYRAAGGHRLPVVMVIHGGSWGGGNKGELTALDRRLAADGYAVVAIN
jgi:acetyl esterase/lipase